MTQHPFLDRVIVWAEAQEFVRAVVVTGSLARDDGSVDAWSDLDAQIIAVDIAPFIRDDSWLDSLGEVWIRFPLHEPAPYRLVIFAGGLKVDFQFASVSDIQRMIRSGRLSDEYQRGYCVALDKDGLYAQLPPSPRMPPQPAPPSPQQIQAAANEFFFEAIQVAQQIRRREYWVVKHRDWTMKCLLLRMLEWHAYATASDEPINAFTIGKRIRHWSAHYAELGGLFCGWDAPALWQSLLRQVDLFMRTRAELERALGQKQADDAQGKMVAHIRRLRAEDDLA